MQNNTVHSSHCHAFFLLGSFIYLFILIPCPFKKNGKGEGVIKAGLFCYLCVATTASRLVSVEL